MWYIVDAKEGAHIIYGMKDRYDREQIKSAIENGTLETLMNYVPVKKGETYFIPSGTVHAICGGLLIAEIQQNSNITYRVYDYNRRQPDGSLRQLHIDDALNVIETVDPSSVPVTSGGEAIAKCRYFTVKKYSCKKEICADESSFVHLLCVDGNAYIEYGGERCGLSLGESIFVPAGYGKFTVFADGATVLATTL